MSFLWTWLGGGPTMSYHITKDFGNQKYVMWWPMASFGHYCTNEATARAEFARTIQDEGGYQLIRYQAVTSTFGSVLGVTGKPEILEERRAEN